jgi:hypothetical protein
LASHGDDVECGVEDVEVFLASRGDDVECGVEDVEVFLASRGDDVECRLARLYALGGKGLSPRRRGRRLGRPPGICAPEIF